MKDDEQEEKVWEMMSEKWKWRGAAQKQINSVQRKKLYLDHKLEVWCILQYCGFFGKYYTTLDISCLSLLKDQFSNLFELLRPPSPGICRSKDLLFLLSRAFVSFLYKSSFCCTLWKFKNVFSTKISHIVLYETAILSTILFVLKIFLNKIFALCIVEWKTEGSSS